MTNTDVTTSAPRVPRAVRTGPNGSRPTTLFRLPWALTVPRLPVVSAATGDRASAATTPHPNP
jgi:hypothetical protein